MLLTSFCSVESTEELVDLEIKIENKRGEVTSLVYPYIITCNCHEDHGTCADSIDEIKTSELGPFVTEAACKCKPGFEGKDCSLSTSPCRYFFINTSD